MRWPVAQATIRTKLSWVVFLCSSTAMAVACGVMIWSNSQAAHVQLVQQSLAATDMVALNVAAAVDFGDAEAAGEVLQTLRSQPLALAATVFDLQGAALAQFRAAGVQGVDPQTLPSAGVGTLGDTLTVSRPVVLGGRRVGRLTIATDLGPLRRRIDRQIGVGIGALLLGSLIGLLLASRLLMLVTRPVDARARGRVPARGNRRPTDRRRRAGRRLALPSHFDALGALPGRRRGRVPLGPLCTRLGGRAT